MYIENLVFGLLDTSRRIESESLAAQLRSFTISWSRYGYHDLIIEKSSLNEILDEASALGYKYCLVQAHGHIIAENWHPNHSERKDFQTALRDWIDNHDFFVTGHIVERATGWYGLRQDCVLVNLEYYEAFGRPLYHPTCESPVEVAQPIRGPKLKADAKTPLWLLPSGQTVLRSPELPGWNFIDVSLKHGKTVYNFDESIVNHKLYVNPEIQSQAGAFDGGRARAQSNFQREAADLLGEGDGREFLHLTSSQMENATRGVFLWNVESYEDVGVPPPQFKAPLKTLYSVAAGFKPNMILHTHGFDEQTEIVFFDYSRNALRIRQLLHQEWDGEDYPRFVKYILDKFPAPDTFYQLWAGTSPDNLNWADVAACWRDEVDRWGGERVIKNHWAAYKELRHVYVECNILTEQDKLLDRITRRPDSVIWWSNAFFTVYANLKYTINERKRNYDDWINQLAAANPDIFIYGSDYNNISVNCIQAGTYAEQYSKSGGDYLNPLKLCATEIRF